MAEGQNHLLHLCLGSRADLHARRNRAPAPGNPPEPIGSQNTSPRFSARALVADSVLLLLFCGCGRSCGCACLAVLAAEALHAAGGIHELLLAGEEGVATGTNFSVNLSAMGGTRSESAATRAHHPNFVVCRMNRCLHGLSKSA